jgi:hypothetical protein
MRVQHVVLALAAWYLLVAPPAGTQGINTEVPQSDWSRGGTYESWADCDAARQTEVDTAVRASDEQRILAAESAVCEEAHSSTPPPAGPSASR